MVGETSSASYIAGDKMLGVHFRENDLDATWISVPTRIQELSMVFSLAIY
jgi:hypothetical protein